MCVNSIWWSLKHSPKQFEQMWNHFFFFFLKKNTSPLWVITCKINIWIWKFIDLKSYCLLCWAHSTHLRGVWTDETFIGLYDNMLSLELLIRLSCFEFLVKPSPHSLDVRSGVNVISVESNSLGTCYSKFYLYNFTDLRGFGTTCLTILMLPFDRQFQQKLSFSDEVPTKHLWICFWTWD